MAEADKLTLRQKLTEYKENYLLTKSQMVKYQSMLYEKPHVR
jgi:hypothetical protein